MKITY